MLAGDTSRAACPCDQGTSSGRGSQLTENSSKIGSPTGNRASDAGLDFSDGSELAKKENDHILLSGGSVLGVQCSVFSVQCSVGDGQLVHAASRATNRPHRRLFAQLFWRTCRSFKVDGAEILDQVRRFSMPRASIAETSGSKGVAGAGSLLARSIEQTDAGQRRRRQVLQSPLFTPVYGCSSVSVAVPNSPTDRTAIGSNRSLHISLGNQQIGRKAVLFKN